ncbi:hypothetical protein F4679DRAFT_334616 [Xylaria curta]|nr:hypothetical protein F4679DRAFT_334616 [Xylaria curta]
MAESLPMVVALLGGSPWLEWDFNTSSMIRDLVPFRIDRPGKRSIHILKYPIDVPCNYQKIIEITQRIWSGDGLVSGNQGNDKRTLKPAFALHMGMRSSYPGFCVETFARRDGYSELGDEGDPFPSELFETGGLWEGFPSKLYSDLNISQITSTVSHMVPGVDIKVSDNCGLYFCEFELFATLAELRRQNLPAKAVFLHVPTDKRPEAIQLGVRIVEAIVQAIVDHHEV